MCLFYKVAQQDKLIIFPISKEYPISRGPQLPQVAVRDMFDRWCTDLGTIGFQQLDVLDNLFQSRPAFLTGASLDVQFLNPVSNLRTTGGILIDFNFKFVILSTFFDFNHIFNPTI